MNNKAYIVQQDICKPLLKYDYKKNIQDYPITVQILQ